MKPAINPKLGVIITAAGSSSRFGGDKLTELIDGRSVLARSIAAFTGLPEVADLVVAISPNLPKDSPLAREIASIQSTQEGIRFAAAGGASRAETVVNAIRQLDTACEFIAIHDGARPLVSREVIDRVFEAARREGAAAPAVAVTSTIKQGGDRLPTLVERTVPRATLWAMQTPQVIRRDWLLDAIERCPIPLGQVTDDVQLLELVDHPVTLVQGDERNLKITTKLDLELARLLLVPSPGTPGEG